MTIIDIRKQPIQNLFFAAMVSVGLMMTAFVSPVSADMLPKTAEKRPALNTTWAIQNYMGSVSFLASRSELNRIDADPVPELITLVNNQKQGKLVRERALRCLALYQDARVKKALEANLTRTKLTKRELILTAMAYLEAFGEDVVTNVLPLLSHDDMQVRANVARGLGMFGGQSGYDAIAARIDEEPDAKVRAIMRPYVFVR